MNRGRQRKGGGRGERGEVDILVRGATTQELDREGLQAKDKDFGT